MHECSYANAQFCSDPVVESVIIDLLRVSFPVSQGLLVIACLTVVAGGHHNCYIGPCAVLVPIVMVHSNN